MPDASAAIAALSAVLIVVFTGAAGAAEIGGIFPQPKEICLQDGPQISVPVDQVTIVTGRRASAPEEYAAEMLQRMLRYQHGTEVTAAREDSAQASGSRLLIVLGQRETCDLAATLAAELKLDEKPPRTGHDGYCIYTGKRGGRQIALVLGANDRSVIYGQDALSQIINISNGNMTLPQVSIKDWSSVKWRGRPHASRGGYDRPGTFDFFAQSRVNYIDLRDGSAIYGTPPGQELNKGKLKWIIDQAHRRGMFVYGTVNCAVPEPMREDVLPTFQEFIDLGVDGLWMSIDDPGGDERIGTPFDLVARIVELGRKHGMTGEKIAMTPGKESYKSIDTATNRRVMQIPGMDEALLFFTVLPSSEAVRQAAGIGLKTLPCWWHNWPRPRGGFLHIGSASYRVEGGYPYMELPEMSYGWHTPGWEELRNAGSCVAAVQPWGGSLWMDYWVAGVINLWAWAPELHDWTAHRRRVYALLYGPDHVQTAFMVDDALIALKRLLHMSPDDAGDGKGQPEPAWPPRLRDINERPTAHRLIDEIEDAVRSLQRVSPERSVFEQIMGPGSLERYCWEPLRQTIETARKVTDLAYPEYWWDTQQQRTMMAARLGQGDTAAKWADHGQRRALAEAAAVVKALPELRDVASYQQSWEERFQTPAAAVRASAPPNMEGDLSDPVWGDASPITGFGLATDAGETEDQTEVRILYTEDSLYLGFTCFERSMDRLLSAASRSGDAVWEDDSVEIFVNTDCLGRPYGQFVASVEGLKYEGRQGASGSFDDSWNSVWEVKTATADDRWTAEIRIPFRSLQVDAPESGDIWMMNFVRNDHSSQQKDIVGAHWLQNSAWGYAPRGGNHDPRKFRPVVFR